MLEEVHGHLHRAVGAGVQIAAGDQLRELVAHGGAHLVVVPQPVAGAAREQVVPLAPGTRGIHETGRPCHFFVSSLVTLHYSCDNSVVT
jgi:hypothetical protein